MPRSRNLRPGPAPEEGGRAGVDLLPAPDLAAGLFDDLAPVFSGAGEILLSALDLPKEPLIAFDAPDELDFSEEMPKVDLKSYWIKAIQQMSDEELVVFDALVSPLSEARLRSQSQSRSAPPLPKRAPELYSERKDKHETFDRFLTRVYGRWLADGRGMSRADYRILDPKGAASLDVWLQTHMLPKSIKFKDSKASVQALDEATVKVLRRMLRGYERRHD